MCINFNNNIIKKSKILANYLKKILLFFFISVNILNAQNEFEIVESAPVETIYENSTLAKTPDVWNKMIDDASVSIDIETFYFADEINEPLEIIMGSLKNAADRGVRIRIIVDSSFYSRNDKSVDKLEGIENITIKKIPFGNLGGGVMHAKYFIVDNENLFLGSQNSDWRALKHIHEIGIRIKNKTLAQTFTELFETDWNLCDGNITGLVNQRPAAVVNSEKPVSINSDKYGEIILYPAFSPPDFNIPGVNNEEDELVKIISNTKEKLFIQIYSFSDKDRYDTLLFDRIENALKESAGRNVKIRMLIPDWEIGGSSQEFIKKFSQTKNIEIKIISIPLYSEGFIPFARVDHSKYMIADSDISWISTSNWESGYFRHSRNVSMVIKNIPVNNELRGAFEMGWTSPYSKKIEINKNYEPIKRN
ncbi:MAG: phospholipase D-like domain-containing protein [Ignavibacteria bacterium]